MGNELTMRGMADEQQVQLANALASPFDNDSVLPGTSRLPRQETEMDSCESVEFAPMRRDVGNDDEIGDGSPRSRRFLDRISDRQIDRHMDDSFQGSLRGGDL